MIMEILDQSYLLVTIRKWNLEKFKEEKNNLPGKWHLINDQEDLTLLNVQKYNPRYIFFPHWSIKVPSEIINKFECVCFHETDLPFGRGGSPIQNLISNGFKSTKISALRMNSDLDSGPIYLKRELSLEGIAEEIFIRASDIIFEMIKTIIEEEIKPKDQTGEITYFKRRLPEDSLIPKEITTLKELYDFIRMLDAEDYPKANILHNSFKFH